MQPIQSQEEADHVFRYLVSGCQIANKIGYHQAQKRVKALFESDILKGSNAEDPDTQRKIDEFLATEI